MSIVKTEELGKRNAALYGKLAAGLLAGLILIQFIQISWIWTLAFFSLILMLILCLDGYRAWVLLLVASLLSGLQYEYSIYTFRPEHGIFALLLIGWILAFMSGRVRIHNVPMLLPLVLYVGVNFLSSALYAADKGYSYNGAALTGLYGAMYLMTVLVLNEYPDKLKTSVKIFIGLGVIQSLYALLTFAGSSAGVNLGELTPGEEGSPDRLQGGFQESDLLGAFAAIVALMIIALLVGRNVGMRVNRLMWALIPVTAVLVLAYARAAWIGFAVGLLLLAVLQVPRRYVFNPGAIKFIVAFTLILILLLSPIGNTLTGGISASVLERGFHILDFSSGSGLGRANVQEAAMERWQESRLLGTGTLSFPRDLARTLHPAGAWLYSTYVQALHDTRVVGLLLLLWFQAGVLVLLFRAYRKATDPFYKAVLTGFIVGMVAMIVASQASSFVWLGFPWIYTGLGVVIAQTVLKTESQSRLS